MGNWQETQWRMQTGMGNAVKTGSASSGPAARATRYLGGADPVPDVTIDKLTVEKVQNKKLLLL